MIKSILKEIIITLLLCIAILLVLGIMFYDYNLLNKVVPNNIAYTTPENIKNEIEQQEVKDILEGRIDVVYSIESTDLNPYQKSNSYVPGKLNPFSAIDESAVEGNGQANNNNNTSGNTTNKEPGKTNTTGRK